MDMLGQKLRRLREVRGVSRESVAELLRVDVTTLGRYESGHMRPPTDKLKLLADHYDVSLDTLLSTDPMIFTIQNAHGTQVGNGVHAKFVQHVVSEDFVREVFGRIDKLMERQDQVNEKLVALLAKMAAK